MNHVKQHKLKFWIQNKAKTISIATPKVKCIEFLPNTYFLHGEFLFLCVRACVCVFINLRFEKKLNLKYLPSTIMLCSSGIFSIWICNYIRDYIRSELILFWAIMSMRNFGLEDEFLVTLGIVESTQMKYPDLKNTTHNWNELTFLAITVPFIHI